MTAARRRGPAVVARATGPSRAPLGFLPRPGRAAWAGAAGALAAAVATGAALWLLHRDPVAADALTRGWLAALSGRERIGLAAGLLGIGVLGGIAHALVFEHLLRGAGWVRGAALGGAQAVALWIALGLIPWLAPRAADPFVYETSLLFDFGRAVLAFLVVHVVYGAVVGWTYGATRARARPGDVSVWRELLSDSRT